MPHSRTAPLAIAIAASLLLPLFASAGGYKGGGHWGGYGPKVARTRVFTGPLRYAPTFNQVPTAYGDFGFGGESVQYSREGGGYPPRQAYYGPGTAHLSSGFQHYGTALERWYGRGYDAPATARGPACGPAPVCRAHHVAQRPVRMRHEAAYRPRALPATPGDGAPCACGPTAIE